ncbi:MAG: 4Fe-4S binding protein, partial [Anaerolineae bacterium]
ETWFCKLCPAGTLEGGIPWVIISADIRQMIGTFYWIKLGILGGFLAWMSVTRRPFCRWICPLGALWAPFNKVSAMHLSVDEDTCIQCNRCQEVCPVNIRVHENPNDSACIRCLACVRACPQNSISVETLNWTLEADRGTP